MMLFLSLSPSSSSSSSIGCYCCWDTSIESKKDDSKKARHPKKVSKRKEFFRRCLSWTLSPSLSLLVRGFSSFDDVGAADGGVGSDPLCCCLMLFFIIPRFRVRTKTFTGNRLTFLCQIFSQLFIGFFYKFDFLKMSSFKYLCFLLLDGDK